MQTQKFMCRDKLERTILNYQLCLHLGSGIVVSLGENYNFYKFLHINFYYEQVLFL